MLIDKACDNKVCIKSEECARYKSYINGNENTKTFKGSEEKACGKFIQK